MGAGDQYQRPSFTVPMPAGATAWPLPARPLRAYCPLCDRPLDFCDCVVYEGPLTAATKLRRPL
jgi:hypothetical protein